jgi:hypothetical protein
MDKDDNSPAPLASSPTGRVGPPALVHPAAAQRSCSECKITKPLTEFYKRRDDFTKRCKECVKQSEKLRYAIKNVENGTYQCYEVDLDELPHQCDPNSAPQDLSLQELKTLMRQHNIPIKAHSNKLDIVESLKQRGILPENYISGLRRPQGIRSVIIPKDKTSPAPGRKPAQPVELTNTADGSTTIFPSLYKAAKFLGTYNNNITKHNGMTFFASGTSKSYKIKIL